MTDVRDLALRILTVCNSGNPSWPTGNEFCARHQGLPHNATAGKADGFVFFLSLHRAANYTPRPLAMHVIIYLRSTATALQADPARYLATHSHGNGSTHFSRVTLTMVYPTCDAQHARHAHVVKEYQAFWRNAARSRNSAGSPATPRLRRHVAR